VILCETASAVAYGESSQSYMSTFFDCYICTYGIEVVSPSLANNNCDVSWHAEDSTQVTGRYEHIGIYTHPHLWGTLTQLSAPQYHVRDLCVSIGGAFNLISFRGLFKALRYLKRMHQILQQRGLYVRDPQLGISPYLPPLGSCRDGLSPLSRLERPSDLVRGGSLGRAALWDTTLDGRPGLGARNALLRNGGGLGLGLRDPLGRYPRGLDDRLGRLGHLSSLSLLSYDRHRLGSWPHGFDHIYHNHRRSLGRDCDCRDCCGEIFSSNCSGRRDFKTKDVTVRGKARAIRASYLAEAGKFEADLVKFMEKKSEEEIPDRVVEMLISFINNEGYSNRNILHEVILNILASNVGAKSTAEHSLSRIKEDKEWLFTAGMDDICHIITLITQSGRVDDGLKKWLEKLLRADRKIFYHALLREPEFHQLSHDRPEVVAEVERMAGERVTGEDGFHPL
jgi:hypothetical protein